MQAKDNLVRVVTAGVPMDGTVYCYTYILSTGILLTEIRARPLSRRYAIVLGGTQIFR